MAHPYLALRPDRNVLVSHYVVAGSKNPLPLGMGSVKDKFYDLFINENSGDMENNQSPGGEKSIGGDGKKSTGEVDKKSEISNTSIKYNSNLSNTDLSNTDNKASTNVEVNYKALSRDKVQNKLPYEYTQEQFNDFINGKVSEIIKEYFPDEQDNASPISQIVSYFYEKYYEKIGERHPIMSDAVYLGVVKKLLNPIDAIWKSDERLNVLGYEAMIDRFFSTDYGEKSGNRTDYRIGYFFSDTVMENLYYRELY